MTGSDLTSPPAPPPRHQDDTREWPPLQDLYRAAHRPRWPIGEGSRIIRVPVEPRPAGSGGVESTRIMTGPVRATAPVPPTPQPATPVSWWKALLQRVRAALR